MFSDVIAILKGPEISSNYIKVIQELNKNNKRSIKRNNEFMKEVPVFTRIFQGENLETKSNTNDRK